MVISPSSVRCLPMALLALTGCQTLGGRSPRAARWEQSWTTVEEVLAARDPRPQLIPSRPLAATRAHALADRPPSAPSPRPWSPPQIQETALPNGMRLLYVGVASAPTVAIEYVNRHAGEDDVGVSAGLAGTVIQMLSKGSTRAPNGQLAVAFERRAMSLAAVSAATYAALETQSQPAEFSQSVQWIADAVLAPELSTRWFSEVQHDALMARQVLLESASRAANEFVQEQLYGPAHRFGRPIAGTEQDIQSRQLSQVQEFYRQRYVPAHSALVVVGPVTLEQAQAAIRQSFGSWQSTVTPREAAVPGQTQVVPPSRMNFVITQNDAITTVRLAFRSPVRGTQEMYSVTLLERILGGMPTSRMAQTLRMQDGYSYDAMSSVRFGPFGGMLYAWFNVEPPQTNDGLRRAIGEIERLRTELVSPEELARAKALATAQFVSMFSETSSTASAVASLFAENLPQSYLQNYRQNIEAVTPMAVQSAAVQFLDLQRGVVAITGEPVASSAASLTQFGLGTVQYFRTRR